MADPLLVFRQFVEHADIALAMVDAEMRYLAVSPRWRADFGLGETPLTGRSHYDLFPQTSPAQRAVHQRCLAGLTAPPREAPLTHPDGRTQWIAWAAQPWHTPAGTVGGLVLRSEDVTARKAAEEARAASESTLRAAIDAMSDAVFISDTGGRFLLVNEAFATFHRWPNRAACALALQDYPALFDVFLPSGERATFEQWAVPRALRGETAVDQQYHLRRKDTGERWVGSFNLAPIRGTDGAIVGAVVIGRDVTERASFAKALETSEARYRGLAEQIPDGIFIADAQGRYVDANQAGCAMVGYSLGELRTLTLASLLADGELERLPAQIEALRSGASVRTEWRFRRKDGSEFQGELIGAQLPDGRYQGVLRDVSDRASANQAIHALEAQVRADAETLHALLSTSAQGILSIDEQGTVLTANLALESMLGWTPGELVGQPHAVLLPPALRSRHAEKQAAYWTAPRARPMGSGLELVAQRKDGGTVPVEISLAPVETMQGRMVFGFVTDASSRRRQEEERAAHARVLEQQALMLRRLVSELTLAEQQAREDLARVLHDHLQQVLFSARMRLQRLTNRPEDFGAANADLLEQTRREVDEAISTTRSFVAELFPPMLHSTGLAAALTWLQGWAREKYGLTIALSADPAANPQARDIRTLVFESVKELVFNAAKHACTDHLQISLTRTPEGNVRLVVSDGGVGFDPSAMLLPGHDHGTGFGLLAIRERLTGLGGRLDIDAAPGRGARFTLTAPCLATAATPGATTDGGPTTTAALGGPSATATPRPLRVLLADDHALVRDGLRQLLSDQPGLAVVGEAADGEQALALARDLRPDVIVMDVAMPRMDGVEATRRIHAAWPEIVILGLSTQERPGGLHDIEEAGAAGYFTKGDDAQHLLARLVRMHTHLRDEPPSGPS